jgi:hypothetical protein
MNGNMNVKKTSVGFNEIRPTVSLEQLEKDITEEGLHSSWFPEFKYKCQVLEIRCDVK